MKFCNNLSEKEGLKSFYEFDGQTVRVPDWKGPGYRLPTEAEWEYACRAKSTTPYSFGAAPTGLNEHGWYEGNSGGQTHPVGQKSSNTFGLFDMHGNIWEWCWDEYDERYYQESPVDDPRGPTGAAACAVIRGGSGVVVSEYWISAMRVRRHRRAGIRCRSEGTGQLPGFPRGPSPVRSLSRDRKRRAAPAAITWRRGGVPGASPARWRIAPADRGPAHDG